MTQELGQISFYLAKSGNSFDSVIDSQKVKAESDSFKIRTFEIGEAKFKFFCEQSTSTKPNPPWLDFINEKLEPSENKIIFDSYSRRPSGTLLIKIGEHLLAAAFGTKGATLLSKKKFLSDFGIKTAMNMCGNKEIRQARSRTHTINTQNIDRQLSQPSEALDFGFNDTELLKYLSAQLTKNVTLQGKDNLTIKLSGDKKLSWQTLLEYCEEFTEQYAKDTYKELFPNYPNFQTVSDEKIIELDETLVNKIKAQNFSCIHLAIPDFLADDEYSFSYSNHSKNDNVIFSHLRAEQLSEVLNLEKLEIKKLKSKDVFAYCHLQSKVLGYKNWTLYDCIVAELEVDGEYFVLSSGEWRKVDDDFYQSVEAFINDVLEVKELPQEYHNMVIADMDKKQNREELFNSQYRDKNPNALLFDQAKLKIGQSKKDKEFCDLLELVPNGSMKIIHVKQSGGSSSMNHLFSQARLYCDFFLRDSIFLNEIRGYINASSHAKKATFLEYIKENIKDINGVDYEVGLWLLYDKSKAAPSKESLPLMAKYEMKLTCEKLTNINKFKSVSLSMVPVTIVNFKTKKKNS